MAAAPSCQIENYQVFLLEEIGRGAYGTVYKARHPDHPGKVFAAKKITVRNDNRAPILKEVENTVRLPSGNNNIVKNFDIFMGDVLSADEHAWIINEYCEFGDLNAFFKDSQEPISSMIKLDIGVQISNGLAFLHEHKIVHRDIKPENILVQRVYSDVCQVKMADYGLSKFLDPNADTSKMYTNVGTRAFKAPEFWNRSPDGIVEYHKSVDIFSTGLTLLAMVQHHATSSYLIPKVEQSMDSSEVELPIGQVMFLRQKHGQPAPHVIVDDVLNDNIIDLKKTVIRDTIAYRPQERISAQELHQKMLEISTVAISKVSHFLSCGICFWLYQFVKCLHVHSHD